MLRCVLHRKHPQILKLVGIPVDVGIWCKTVFGVNNNRAYLRREVVTHSSIWYQIDCLNFRGVNVYIYVGDIHLMTCKVTEHLPYRVI